MRKREAGTGIAIEHKSPGAVGVMGVRDLPAERADGVFLAFCGKTPIIYSSL